MPEPDTKIRPFLFDVNNFDDAKDAGPPVFNEAEMDAARRDAHEKGRLNGLAEAKAQREKLVADLIAAIRERFNALIAAESYRAAQYEAETVFLCKTIFARLFPALNERNGLDEVAHTIASVLESQRTVPEVIIEVAPDYLENIRAQIGLLLSAGREGACTVTANPELSAGDCRLRWEDGGAARSARQIAEQIAKLLEQTLADRAILRDNKVTDAPTGES